MVVNAVHQKLPSNNLLHSSNFGTIMAIFAKSKYYFDKSVKHLKLQEIKNWCVKFQSR